MPLTVNTNVASLSAQRSMFSTNNALQTSFERLASGKRINSASDDAAGLAVSQSLTSAINGVNQAMRNANDGISAAQIAEGALSEVSDILQRMRELAVQANTSFLSATEKGYLQAEQVSLESALTDVATAAKFSGTSLFAASTFTFQTGSSASETSSFTSKAVAASGITDNAGNSVDLTAIDLTANNAAATANNASLAGGAQAAIEGLDDVIAGVSDLRADFGAAIAEFESQVRNLANIGENTAAARSRIMDTDYAAETANLTKNQILQQASTSILAQANQQPQAVMALLQ